jgi:hypothetical protein
MEPQSNDPSPRLANAPPLSQVSTAPHCAAPTSEPPDPSALPVTASIANANIICYERRAGHGIQLSNAAPAGEVMVIDESTPTPPIPRRQPYVPVGQRRPQGDGEVLYIGPE